MTAISRESPNHIAKLEHVDGKKILRDKLVLQSVEDRDGMERQMEDV